MKTFLIAAAALSLTAGAALAQDKPAAGAMSSSMSSSAAKPAGAMTSSMSSSDHMAAKPMSKKDMEAMEACHKMSADAMAKDKKCEKLMAMAKPAGAMSTSAMTSSPKK